MKATFRHTKILSFLFIALSFLSMSEVHAVNSSWDYWVEYTELRAIDNGTYNEYRYKMTSKFFDIRKWFQVDKVINKTLLLELDTLAKQAYNYLPDNLDNQQLLIQLESDIERALKQERSESTFNQLTASIERYVEEVAIDRMTGTIEVTPQEWNAPLTTTLRANIKDPTGTKNSAYNYVWMVNQGWQDVVIGRNTSINYTFTEEGNYSIFLWVKSNHRNSSGNIDVIPFYGKADIRVKEKVASVIIKVNASNLGSNDDLKFDREDSKYWLLFDATSSTPNSGNKFVSTQWDFWNGITRRYDWPPRVEKIPYATDGTYPVLLKLTTNSGKSVERKFVIYINHPAASIQSSKDEWFIWDQFTFSSKWYKRGQDTINYAWEIVDIQNDTIIHTKNSTLFNYTFTKKWDYNVILEVTMPSGEIDRDSKVITIGSRAPDAQYTSSIPYSHQPSYVFLDASKSFDPDISDDGKLSFTWLVDWERVALEEANENGSVWYYRFDSIGDHSIGLEVTDPDGMSDIKTGSVTIKSLLDVDFTSFPTAIQRDGTIKFTASSLNAKFYEWNFGDGIKDYGSNKNIEHKYEKSWSFQVKLIVTDEKNNTNTVVRNVFVWKSDAPVAVFEMTKNGTEPLAFDSWACEWKGWYLADKISTIKFDSSKSIDLDGVSNGLKYSWKIGNNKYETVATPSYKFDEIGCFPIKLTVTSGQNWSNDVMEWLVDVKNILPQLSSLSISSNVDDTDPIIFDISAIGAKDADWVIQSYLWYYYTDYDEEPQWFKTTPTPQTSFVLPKITGTYFFSVVVTDNNEERFSSQDIGTFFRTVSSDNENTPIIDLSVNNNSVAIWEEVVFVAKVKDIINRDLSASSEYYWDFDGDGFYEQKGTTPTISHKYTASGTFFPKLKVRHKWLSNVRNLRIDVSNRLKADFEYISVWNKFIFLDKSQWKIESAEWNFGDGSVSKTAWNVVHEFDDGERVHTVELTIQEWTKKETISKEVVTNMKNLIKARKSWVNLFSSPIIEDDVMVLAQETERAIIYPWEASNSTDAEISFYAVDFDIETDSDLNGGKDDDIDNSNTASYRNGTPLTIELNKNKSQKIRVFTLDSDEKLIDVYDFTIEKDYIVEQEIDLDAIEFAWVTDNEKEKIERLKDILWNLPTDSRLPAMKYVEKLQDEWFDARGKTDTIVEMQLFLNQIPNYDPTDVNELLESFLIDDNADKWERQVAFNALQNLIPQTVTCTNTWEYDSCSELLNSKLEAIKNGTNIDEKKALGTEILEIIWAQSDELMSSESKLRYKEVLKNFVYWGIAEVPDEEKVIPDVPRTDNEKSFGLLKWVLYITAWILWLLFFWLLLFFIFYKFSNKDKNVEFQDFIIEKTSGGKQSDKEVDNFLWDITSSDNTLANIDFWETPKKKIEKKVENKIEPITEVKETKPWSEKSSQEKAPDWLGNIEKDLSLSSSKTPSASPKINPVKPIESTEKNWKVINEESDTWIPSWLKWAWIENASTPKQDISKQDVQKNIPKFEDKKMEKKPENTTSEKNSSYSQKLAANNTQKSTSPRNDTSSQKTDESSIPDWLKWSMDNKKKAEDTKDDANIIEKKEESVIEVKQLEKQKPVIEKQEVKKAELSKNTVSKTEKKLIQKQNLDELTKIDDGIPDWLKWSFDDKKKDVKVEDKKVETSKTPQDTREQEKITDKKIEKTSAIDTKQEPRVVDIVQDKKPRVEEKQTTPIKPVIDLTPKNDVVKKQTPKEKREKNLWEGALWEDGMEIPDWLKWDDIK